jgi:hypothetical protein
VFSADYGGILSLEPEFTEVLHTSADPRHDCQSSAPWRISRGCAGSVPTSVPKRGPRTIKRHSTPTKFPIKNGPEIDDFRPVLGSPLALANRRLQPPSSLEFRPKSAVSAVTSANRGHTLRGIIADVPPSVPSPSPNRRSDKSRYSRASALARSEDTIRWHPLGARCREARGPRSIRDVSLALAIPQYRAPRACGADANLRAPLTATRH